MIGDNVLEINFNGLPDLLHLFVYIGVLEYLKQPRFRISSLFVLIQEPIGFHIGLLDQVIGIILVVSQVISKGLQCSYMREELLFKNYVLIWPGRFFSHSLYLVSLPDGEYRKKLIDPDDSGFRAIIPSQWKSPVHSPIHCPRRQVGYHN